MPINHVGTKNIETARLTLRKFTLDDVDSLYHNCTNDLEMTRFLSWFPHNSIRHTRLQCKIWISAYKKINYYHWAIIQKSNSQAIGSIGIPTLDDTCAQCEVAYYLSRPFWGQGIMTEALQVIIQFMFNLGFEKIYAKYISQNIASEKVLKNCNMVYFKTVPGKSKENRNIDYIYMVILK